MSKRDFREDGRIRFDDQICEMADLLLKIEGIRHMYLKKRDRSWIRKIGDEGMKYAFMKMPDIQIRMIELLIFEGRTVTDIRIIFDLTMTEMRREIKSMRDSLVAVM